MVLLLIAVLIDAFFPLGILSPVLLAGGFFVVAVLVAVNVYLTFLRSRGILVAGAGIRAAEFGKQARRRLN